MNVYAFCDWVTVRIFIKHDTSHTGGQILRLSTDGVQEWSKDLWQSVQREGSYSSIVALRSVDFETLSQPFVSLAARNQKPLVESLYVRYGDDLNMND